MPAAIDLTGRKYNRLTVLHKDPANSRKWLCRCDCGTEKAIDRNSFLRGLTTSCGCVHAENHTTHGDYGTRLYRIWNNMKRRCSSESDPQALKNYKARGIYVCPEWADSFEAFRDWSLANGYADDLSIDRIDDAKVYSPATCRWATDAVQSRNRRSKAGSSSQYVGVSQIKETGRYRAALRENDRKTHIGVFATEEEAAQARDAYIRTKNLEGYVINFK